ncbi:MotE family protein [Parvularcula sp. IMCC14364]|uniref:MotE family protein n=1 Tax=Parvularcula sp. IMCC14364 TaxID=3067902 RepID=UPI0027422186|nr:hypothetical protein [Parvularcula sp. IMCC14364]
MKSSILPILGAIFAISLVGRSLALNGANAGTEEKTDTEVTASAQPAEVKAEPDVCVSGPILESFKQQQANLQKREQAIADRERTLEAVEKRLNERLAVLDESNARLADKMEAMKRTANEDITHLTSMYENMKPAQASTIFDKMDPVFAAGFLREMRSEQAGLILANMRPEQAYEISIIIASKNADLRPTVQ